MLKEGKWQKGRKQEVSCKNQQAVYKIEAVREPVKLGNTKYSLWCHPGRGGSLLGGSNSPSAPPCKGRTVPEKGFGWNQRSRQPQPCCWGCRVIQGRVYPKIPLVSMETGRQKPRAAPGIRNLPGVPLEPGQCPVPWAGAEPSSPLMSLQDFTSSPQA